MHSDLLESELMDFQLPDTSEAITLLLAAPTFVLLMMARSVSSLLRTVITVALVVVIIGVALVGFGIIPTPEWWPL